MSARPRDSRPISCCGLASGRMDASESFLPDFDGTVAVSFGEGTAFNANSSMPAFCAGSFAGFSCVTQSGRLVSQPATAKMAQTANACQIIRPH